MASYFPMHLADVDYYNSQTTLSSLMRNSQRMKLFLDPCESQGGEMTLPFFWPYDMLDLTAGDYDQMGVIQLQEINALKHANGAVSPITINVYAWMTDVKLSAPTQQDILAITPQSGDEYGSSPVSSMATSVARTAGKLSGAPMIGPYMKATEIAAGALASVAKMFGFSRPVQLEPATFMNNRPLGSLAVTDVGDASCKLTVDSKQELSIDPSIVGVDSTDTLDLASIASRESYLTTFSWGTGATIDTLLYNMRVSPLYCQSDTVPLGTAYTIPACLFAALPFKYWRGTMRYRFQIVASQYHKGRLRFVWDPVKSNGVTESNVAYTKIVDISNERDFVIDVSWGQPKSWLELGTLAQGLITYRAGIYTNSVAYANGVLSVNVLNELATPNSSVNNDIQINVFVSMCDDAEFAAPADTIRYLSPTDGTTIVPQSDVEHETELVENAPEMAANTDEFVPCAPLSDPTALVYMGESVKSFRSLLKRYFTEFVYIANTATSIVNFRQTDFPMKFGYTPYGTSGTTPNFYNNAQTGYARYMTMAFLAYRGGVRRKYYVNQFAGDFPTNIAVTRESTFKSTSGLALTTIGTTATVLASQFLSLFPSGLQGYAWSPTRMNPAVEVELPFYRAGRFALCRRPNSTVNATTVFPFVEDLDHSVATVANGSKLAILSMSALAEDSSFYCFQGCQPFLVSPTLV